MTLLQQGLLAGFGLVVVIAAARMFKGPFRWALRAVLNGLAGVAGIAAANIFGLGLGITLLNVAVTAVLGLPGLALLIGARWLFG